VDQSWRDVVREGYDAISRDYRGDHDTPEDYREGVALVRERLPADGGDVLDLGCGCGVPVSRDLAAAGHRVVGVDVSSAQVERARRLVPTARFERGDVTEVGFARGSFDAVVCLYTLIHLPDAEQKAVVRAIGSWLRPGGLLVATVGARAWTGVDRDWLNTGVAMWWNHPDLATFRGWLRSAELEVEREQFVPEGIGGHQLIVASPARR